MDWKRMEETMRCEWGGRAGAGVDFSTILIFTHIEKHSMNNVKTPKMKC
jgi:hypothetical protein